MKQIFQIFRYVTFTSLIIFSVEVYGQDSFVLATNQQFKVEGTSTLHDWEMVSTKAEGNASIKLVKGKIASINSLVVDLPVTSLKSGKNAMDKNAHEALQANKNPQIQLELVETEAITDELVKAKIRLSIAGTSNMANWEVSYKLSEDGVLFLGSHRIKFSDFKVDPPKAVFGTIKTGDELELSFETTFKKTSETAFKSTN
jgi:hypothetical protein